ncbi:DUF4166 domain-containing protein [Variovorax paradoxus]|uniref:DUF4166 domain-containing protein n=1 Tax=Variovorax paradoxus (strain EPS) TaxID=595537 RepID=E6V7P2_VARPE|nr:DUF4166 domain-containing protein [Variovorax paradoxus]ADU36055.1 hypothetical protein Varpa_1845 [Variovorax paradoxus EPS]
MTRNHTQPVFQQALGSAWEKLGDVIRRHYTMTPFSDDYVCVRGTMNEVHHAPWAALLMPFGRLFGALVPYTGTDVPIEVHYRCSPGDANLYWDRVFHFAGRKPFHFRSHMEHTAAHGAEVIEYVRFGIGMRLAVSAEDGALVFRDQGYIWRVAGLRIPLPLGLFMGTAYVEERPDPTSPEHFTMKMLLRHRWFGDVFRYSGRFHLPSSPASRTGSQ